jgi:putative membrane protein
VNRIGFTLNMPDNDLQAKPASDQLKDEFARAAVLWAADRTLLAWIRTSLSMIGFGVIIHQFANYLQHEGLLSINSRFFGLGLAIFGIIILIFASQVYFSVRQRLLRNKSLDIMRPPLTFFVSIGLCVMGAVGIILMFLTLPS